MLNWQDLYNFLQTAMAIVVGKLKLTLTIKEPSLLYLASYISYHYIMITLSRPMVLKLKILSYLSRTIITNITKDQS